jgi:hypothetical protein
VPKGVTICNVFGHEPAIAEYVLMTMLVLTHRLFESVMAFRVGSWVASPQFGGGSPHGEVFRAHDRDHRLRQDRARSGGTRRTAQMPRPRRQPPPGRRSHAVRNRFSPDRPRSHAAAVRHDPDRLRSCTRNGRTDRCPPPCPYEARHAADQCASIEAAQRPSAEPAGGDRPADDRSPRIGRGLARWAAFYPGRCRGSRW